MKKIFFIAAFVICSLNAEAQMTLQGGGTTMLTFRKSNNFNDTNIAGSRYLNEQFNTAKVNKGTQDFMIRYNAYNDLMEYKNGSDILELVKEQNTYFQFSNGEIIELLNYNIDGNDFSRYHQILTNNGNVKVSKFRSIKLNPAKAASNSYDTGTDASFKPNKDVYFITYNNQTIEFDGKSKSLEKLIPSKESEIKKFFKENKIRENDADMIKVGNFLSGL